MTIPAPTLFQNEAANLTRSLRCSVELLSKCSSSRMSVLLKYAVPVWVQKRWRCCGWREPQQPSAGRMRQIANRKCSNFFGARFGVLCHDGSYRLWARDEANTAFVPLALSSHK